MARRPTAAPGLIAAGIAAGAGAAGLALAFRRDLRRAAARLEGRARIVPTAIAPVEVAESGAGPPLLVLHGSGGGFDQGLALAAPLVSGMRLIAPSRFGYLGSPMPGDAAPDAQADALAQLLDRLGIARLPVLAASAGAISALRFACRHPDRCTGLALIAPAAFAPGRTPRAWSPAMARTVAALLGSDWLFWLAMRLRPGLVMRAILATDPALVAAAAPEERARAKAVLAQILPVSRRAAGIVADTHAAGAAQPLPAGAIAAPTLIFAARDDRYRTAEAARYLAEQIAGAELHLFDRGGHLLIGRQAVLAERLAPFLARCAQPAAISA